MVCSTQMTSTSENTTWGCDNVSLGQGSTGGKALCYIVSMTEEPDAQVPECHAWGPEGLQNQ